MSALRVEVFGAKLTGLDTLCHAEGFDNVNVIDPMPREHQADCAFLFQSPMAWENQPETQQAKSAALEIGWLLGRLGAPKGIIVEYWPEGA